MINLKVVSPQKVIFEKEVEMAVLPGAEGDFAAMENPETLANDIVSFTKEII